MGKLIRLRSQVREVKLGDWKKKQLEKSKQINERFKQLINQFVYFSST